MSADREWCDVCGADLEAQYATADWLGTGDTVRLAVSRVSGSPRAADNERSLDDTLPPGIRLPDQTNPFAYSVTAPHPSTDTPPDNAATDADGGDVVEELLVTIGESVAHLAHRRIWRASAADGRTFRLEERAQPTREAIPDGVEALSWLVDVPLAAASHGAHEIKLYRDVDGVAMHERREAIERPLTPTEIVEWLRPVVRALTAIHEAGFLCLRLCPYTIKYTRDGGVFLQNVELLYPQNKALPTLPAIAGYTAPEIYEASIGEPPDARADIYSLGMLVYYLIAGDDPPASAYTGYQPAIAPRDIVPEFSIGFVDAVGVLGAADPSARPGDTATLLDVLEEARDRAVQQHGDNGAVSLAVAADTHVGIVKRHHNPHNQDAVFAATSEDGRTALIVVADGVSTASFGSGDLASKLTVETFAEAWAASGDGARGPLVDDAGAWLRETIAEANRRVVARVNADHAPFDGEPSEVMGTTCVAAVIHNGQATIASLGDSRAYLVHRAYIERITRDHNIFTLGIADGLSPDVAFSLPQADALARCIGTFTVDGDGHLTADPFEPDVYTLSLRDRDRLLLCSDGLTDYAGSGPADAERILHQTIWNEDVPELACLALIQAANRGGGGDNVGVAVCYATPRWPGVFDWFAELRGIDDEYEEP